MKAPFRIGEDEFYTRLEKVVLLLSTGTGFGPVEIKELFELHNDRLAPKETNKSCGSCRQRVFNKMNKMYEELKNGRAH